MYKYHPISDLTLIIWINILSDYFVDQNSFLREQPFFANEKLSQNFRALHVCLLRNHAGPIMPFSKTGFNGILPDVQTGIYGRHSGCKLKRGELLTLASVWWAHSLNHPRSFGIFTHPFPFLWSCQRCCIFPTCLFGCFRTAAILVVWMVRME